MNYEDAHIGTVFVAPASYFIEGLEEQKKEFFKSRVFQYDNMVCGIVVYFSHPCIIIRQEYR